jgi:hypothetical protein
MADRQSHPSTLETLVNRPLTTPPEGEDGIGPTLGEDVSVEAEERADARRGAHSEDQGPGA